MTIKRVDERRVSVARREAGFSHEGFDAVVRDGVVTSMSSLQVGFCSPSEESIQRYIIFCQEVLEAIDQSGGQ